MSEASLILVLGIAFMMLFAFVWVLFGDDK